MTENDEAGKREVKKSARRLKAEAKRDEAATLLTHYLTQIGARTGWQPSTDARAEIAAIADSIVEAAVLMALEEIETRRGGKA